ncbi:TetR/AcrR family transcriptional regulator [Paenibacillus sp. GCM10012307]|uniref:TetR/AcrR family transcriptional regulator n=1 Tax=Paenibacillus roseus TaxID=2798579 RepID=A0A934MRU0_9BACL|nr:TetR/AcrR family transcriptional regulator [Paenibacillus roseus]MBJ6362664.1 TetR/AcrR family transcriptional regulator [Paenibacillus roseus]
MQVLKDEVRNSILRCARTVFLDRGFGKTSMKDIAAKAGVAVGNLYRYFPNKEYLFDAVVSPVYDQLMELMIVNEQEFIDAAGVIDRLSHIFAELAYENREGLLILLYKSSGTPFAGTKEEFIIRLTEQMDTHLYEYNRKHSSDPLDLLISRPIAIAFLEGYFDIIRTFNSRNVIQEATKHYIAVWFMGLKAVL